MERFRLETMPELAPRYNIAPTQDVLAVRVGAAGKREATRLRWGLIPSWAKDPSIGAKMINARADTVAEKPSFRVAYKRRRCLILADAYIEWKPTESRKKQPYLIELPDSGPFAMAGLWEFWKPPHSDAESPPAVETCTILTMDANPSIADIHNRMPVILTKEHEDLWLRIEPDRNPPLDYFLAAASDIHMSRRPISTRINNPRTDDAACLATVD